MNCKFIYENDEVSITPVNIVFNQNQHEYAQVYVLCPIGTRSPKEVIIPNLFKGICIFSENIEDITAFYFVNNSAKIESNKVIFIDSETETPRTTFNEIRDIVIISQETNIVRHVPKYLTIIHERLQQKENMLINMKYIIEYTYPLGIGSKKIKVDHIDNDYIISIVESLFNSCKYISLTIQLRFQIKPGDSLILHAHKYIIIAVYHDFKNQITNLKIVKYIKVNGFVYKYIRHIPPSSTIIGNVQISRPPAVENYYYLSIKY